MTRDTVPRAGHRHFATCECGWESGWVTTTAGMVGSAWDVHLATCELVIDFRVE